MPVRILLTAAFLVLSCGSVEFVDAAARTRNRCQPKSTNCKPCNPCEPKACEPCQPDMDAEMLEPIPAEVSEATEIPAKEDPFEPITMPQNVQTQQVASTQSSTAPNMIGDFLSPGFYANFSTNQITGPASGGTRLQIGHNNNPIPQDRFAVTYNHYRNAYTLEDAADNNISAHLDLYTFQYERTFLDGDASIEFRLPFYSAPDNTQTLEIGQEDLDGYSMEMGNISMILKGVLYQDCCERWTVTTGMGLTLPTGPDLIYQDDPAFGTSRTRIENQSIEMTPFLAFVFKPNDRFFSQLFLQANFSMGGDNFTYNRPVAVGPFLPYTQTGSLNHQHLFKMDWQSGYWIYDACDSGCTSNGPWLKKLAAIFELHYTTTMNDADLIAVGDPLFGVAPGYGNLYNRVDVLNCTIGTTAMIGDRGSLTTAVSLPLLEVADGQHLSDSEFLLQYNHYLYPSRCR